MKSESQLRNKPLISKTTSVEEIRQAIGKLREQKGKEKETLKLISEAVDFGHDFVAHLFLEEALTYQHLKSVSSMEKAVLKAKKYIDQHNVTALKSRIFVFLGKVSDSKGQYSKAIAYYKKADKGFESRGFLVYSLIMDGQHTEGYKLAKELYNNFLNSKEGIKLKKKDYTTWVIWLSGLVIRTMNAFLNNKVNFDKKETDKWLGFIEKELNSKPNKFSYRKQELKDLKMKLGAN